mgnify:CR=1 FL=1
MNKKSITFCSYTFFAAAILCLCLSFSMKVNAEEPVMIDGVKYYLEDDGTAEASIDTVTTEDIPVGSTFSEVTVHSQVVYNGKTYTVTKFDASSPEDTLEEMIVRRYPSDNWYYWKHLKKLTIEAGIDFLDTNFSNYIALEEVVFEDPKDMENLGLYFYNCPNLKDIYIPADVDVVPRLRKCPNTTVTFAPDHPKYKVVDGDIYSKNGKILYDVPNGSKNYKVKKTVKKIAYSAFYGNDNIKHIKLPSSVKKLAGYVFGDMKNLKSIKFSKNMKTAAPTLFYRTDKLKTLTFPKNIRKISLDCEGIGLKKLRKIYIKAPNLKKIDLADIAAKSKCTIYVKNSTVRNQIKKSGFKGRIVIQR